jgi:hypothetical protein
MEKIFNHEESLALINEMIARAQNNIKHQGVVGLLFWGYLTAAVAVLNYVLLHTLSNLNQSFWIWWIMLPAGFVSYFIERRAGKKKFVKTHIDKIGAMVWFGFLISFGVFMVVLNMAGSRLGIAQLFYLNTPVIMIMVGMGHFISACIYRHKMWYLIAVQTWAGAVICACLDIDLQFIVFAVCMILGLAIPGHILNYKAKKSHV